MSGVLAGDGNRQAGRSRCRFDEEDLGVLCDGFSGGVKMAGSTEVHSIAWAGLRSRVSMAIEAEDAVAAEFADAAPGSPFMPPSSLAATRGPVARPAEYRVCSAGDVLGRALTTVIWCPGGAPWLLAAFFLCSFPAFFFPCFREPGAWRGAEEFFQAADVIGRHEAEQGVQMRVGESGVLQARDRFACEPGVDRRLFLAEPVLETKVAEPFAEVDPGLAAGVEVGDAAQRRAATVRPSRVTLIHAAQSLPWELRLRHRLR
jgi:hypothetical protein